MSRSAAVLFVLLAFAPGCSGWDSSLDAKDGLVSADLNPDGIIFIVPGVSGGIIGGRMVKAELVNAGCPYAVELYDWSRGVTEVVADVTDIEGNREKARRLAGMIAAYHRAFPGAPLQLVGISGGGAIATWALEELPRSVTVHRLVLVAPALSPGYDLTRALRHVDKDAAVFVSGHDRLILGLGTEKLGTLDGVKTRAAGQVGFVLPAKASAETRRLYGKIRRIDWTLDMMAEGNYGGHLGWLSPPFIRRHIVPIILEERKR